MPDMLVRGLGSVSLRVEQVPAQAALTVPRGLTGTAASSCISLSWNAVSNALGYEIQQWTPATRSWDVLPTHPYFVSVMGTRAIVPIG